ncbi:MAG: hypothetical protein ACLFR2_08480 [Candidatus Kapaibacterium sp.]
MKKILPIMFVLLTFTAYSQQFHFTDKISFDKFTKWAKAVEIPSYEFTDSYDSPGPQIGDFLTYNALYESEKGDTLFLAVAAIENFKKFYSPSGIFAIEKESDNGSRYFYVNYQETGSALLHFMGNLNAVLWIRLNTTKSKEYLEDISYHIYPETLPDASMTQWPSVIDKNIRIEGDIMTISDIDGDGFSEAVILVNDDTEDSINNILKKADYEGNIIHAENYKLEFSYSIEKAFTLPEGTRLIVEYRNKTGE